LATYLEIRDPNLTRRHVLAGLWLSRVGAPGPESVPAVLEWLLCLASEGHPAPPSGFLADVGWLAFGAHDAAPLLPARELPEIEPGLVRRYEDYVLGKLYADLAFERGCDAIVRYEAADRGRGLAYLVERLLVQTGSGGAILNPAAIRSLQKLPPEEVLGESWRLLAGEGLTPEAVTQYDELIESVKNTGDLLAPADIFELERGTALAEFGQRLALRQVLQAAELLAEGSPRQRPRGVTRRRQVATRLLDEDAYPIGGFASISTKGSIESLLHSQLAYLERDARPDLFDVKYVRDELLYYSRDENQFLRRRTTLLVILSPDLTAARTKDSSLPYQRIVLTLGLLLSLVRKLSEWWSDEALELHFVLLNEAGQQPLEDEQALLELLLADQIEQGAAHVGRLPLSAIAPTIARHARRSLVRCLFVSTGDSPLPVLTESVSRLVVAPSGPRLAQDNGPLHAFSGNGLDAWRDALRTLLHSL
jgi:vWA domain found in the FtsH ternary systems/N-terminal helical region fused to the FtsH ternary system vWA domain